MELSAFPERPERSLPALDENGNLPPGDYAPSAEDFENRFVATDRRMLIYEGWNRHRQDLAAAGLPREARQLLNGSFTTAKSMPDDLDLAVEVPVKNLDLPDEQWRLAGVLDLLAGRATRATHGCHAFPILVLPSNHPDYEAVTASAIRYWTGFFGRDREERLKGRVWATVGGFRP